MSSSASTTTDCRATRTSSSLDLGLPCSLTATTGTVDTQPRPILRIAQAFGNRRNVMPAKHVPSGSEGGRSYASGERRSWPLLTDAPRRLFGG